MVENLHPAGDSFAHGDLVARNGERGVDVGDAFMQP